MFDFKSYPLFRGSFFKYTSHDDDDVGTIRRSLIPIHGVAGRDSFNVTFTSLVKKNAFLFSMRGWDNAHIYLWILKDYSWASDNHAMALIFGTSAMAWCAILFAQAIHHRDWEELYFLAGMFMWLFANFWWMAGETEIYGDDDTNSLETSHIMETAIGWLSLYFFVLMPLNVFKDNDQMKKFFEDSGMVPRFACFSNWRQYEYVHMLCWCCKDFAWNRMLAPLWIIAVIPTVLVGVDFIYETYSKNYMVDCAHYAAQLIWVFANASWSIGELFYPEYDDPIPITTVDYDSVRTGRWWACILALCAFIPIAVLYFGWFPYIICGALNERTKREKDLLNASVCGSMGSMSRESSLPNPFDPRSRGEGSWPCPPMTHSGSMGSMSDSSGFNPTQLLSVMEEEERSVTTLSSSLQSRSTVGERFTNFADGRGSRLPSIEAGNKKNSPENKTTLSNTYAPPELQPVQPFTLPTSVITSTDTPVPPSFTTTVRSPVIKIPAPPQELQDALTLSSSISKTN